MKGKQGKVHLNALVYRKCERVKAFFEERYRRGDGFLYVRNSFAAHRKIVLSQTIFRLAKRI